MSPPTEESGNWRKVKVNDEYYLLQESISDTSSSSDGGSDDEQDKQDEEDNSNSDNDHLNSVLIKEELTQNEPVVSNHKTSSTLQVLQHTQQPDPAKIENEYVPLRSKDSSNNADAYNRKRSDSLSKETPERWRMRLWPSKAITAFCRIITRCKPPASTPGTRIGSSTTSNKHKVEKIELQAHWRTSELSKVPVMFDSAAHHSSVFFLLAVEECREAVAKAEDPEQLGLDNAVSKYHGGYHDGSRRNQWLDGEITGIIAESAFAALPKACDPRLGSVWVISVAVSPRTFGSGGGKRGFHGSGSSKENLDLAGGDLMVMHSPQWSHPLLGIIQPWDPDYDIKFGINFSINQSTYISTQKGAGRDGSALQQQVINILVCVDQCDGLGQQDIGGWASQGSIRSGVRFSMAPIGNMMTYIRECQALMSLKLIDKSLQQMIVSASLCSAPNSGAPTAAVGVAMSGALSPRNQQVSPRRRLLAQPVRCPENVPNALWLALSRQYNDSQLRAIWMVSRRGQQLEPPFSTALSGSTAEATLSLLQGPPGTGKTRTILGIVSVFLAGALSTNPRGTTRIVAGASLYGDMAGENSTKWSDEKLSRPRGGSISITAGTDGTPGIVKRTRVLICAPSNTAVDEVVYRLIAQGVLDGHGKRMCDLSVVRIGQPSREEYVKQGFEAAGKHGRGARGLTSSEENMVRVVERVTLDNLVEERRRALMASDTRNQGPILKIADIRKQVLEQADVVCSTLSGAGSQPMLEVVLRLTEFKFDAVVIDEAAQAVEPSSLIPLKYNPQAVVLVGDPCQLPATVFSRTAKHANYNQSLFQRLQIAGYPVVMLETQYRMHPQIADYPSQRFYQGRLVTGSQLITSDSHRKAYHSDPSGRFRPFLFHNVPYGIETTEGTSICNREEALYVVDLFEELIRRYPDHRSNIGIIAPYRAQRRLLNNLFRERFNGRKHHSSNGGASYDLPAIWDLDTEISTIDGFQGREKAIVIFSCVRAPTQRTSHHYKSNNTSENDLSQLSTTGGSSDDPFDVPVMVESRSESDLQSCAASSAESAHSSEVSAPVRSIGFLKEWQRLNVAITRSRYALWIVGHSEVLRGDSEWRHLIEYSKNKSSFYTAPAPDYRPTSTTNATSQPFKSSFKHGKHKNYQQQHYQQHQHHHKKYHKNKTYHRDGPTDTTRRPSGTEAPVQNPSNTKRPSSFDRKAEDREEKKPRPTAPRSVQPDLPTAPTRTMPAGNTVAIMSGSVHSRPSSHSSSNGKVSGAFQPFSFQPVEHRSDSGGLGRPPLPSSNPFQRPPLPLLGRPVLSRPPSANAQHPPE